MTLPRRSRLAVCSILLAGCVARPLAIPEATPPVESIEPTCGPSAAPVAMPEPMFGLAAVTVGGEIFLVGGMPAGSEGSSSSLLSYSTKTGAWRAQPPIPIPLVSDVHAATDGQRIYVADQGHAAVFEVATGAWSPLPPPPEERFGQALAVGADGRVYCFGGRRTEPFPDDVTSRQFFVFDPASQTWSTRQGALVFGTGLMAIALPSGAIYVGANAGALYDPVADDWQAHAAHDRYMSQGAADATGAVFSAGGYYPHGSVVDGLDQLDPVSGMWRSIVRMPIAAKEAGVTIGCDGRVYVFGGTSDAIHDAVQVFDPPSATWQVSP